jgi:hypothetical protein
MNRKLFSIIGLIILSLLLFGAGIWIGQAQVLDANWQPGWMMGNTNNDVQPSMGMMNGSGTMGMMMNNDMMGNMNGQTMPGMMAGQSSMMMGDTGMMGMMSGLSGLSDADPLTIDEVETAVTDYLTTLNQDNLALGEIMIFSNHAYAQVLDSETGQGAFELLVDPSTGNVFPEPGPNMMWNTQYGMMSTGGSNMMGSGMMDDNMMGNGMMNGNMNGQNMPGMMNGNRMGSYGYAPDTEINITAAEAVNIAQEYLDTYLPGKTADDHTDTFPGYYTLHILEDGQIIGMMSVNAYTEQAFLHHWHGDFIEMSEGE